MRVKRIHHLTIAVRDLESARLTFEQLLGAQGDRVADVPAFGIRAIDVPLGDAVLQLAAPASGDNPLMRFLERKGEGFYTLALEVEGLDETVRELASQGVRVSEPIEVGPGVRSAFVTMAVTHGLSVQLVEVAPPAGPPVSISTSRTEEDVVGAPDDDEPPADPAPPPLLDLTPDEWSDID